MLEAGFALKTGSQWAKKAQSLLLADLNIVSVEKGMVRTRKDNQVSL